MAAAQAAEREKAAAEEAKAKQRAERQAAKKQPAKAKKGAITEPDTRTACARTQGIHATMAIARRTQISMC